MQKRDIYENENKWKSWKEKNYAGIVGISKSNSDLILEYLKDMEIGNNTSAFVKKGQRSKGRLLDLKSRMLFFVNIFNNKDLRTITKNEIHELFSKMRNGDIKRPDGKIYIGTDNFVKDFKAFWRWMLRSEKVKEDIVKDLQSKDGHKPDWVYLTEDDFKTLANTARGDYRALIWFMYDTGARVTEAFSVRISDFSNNFTQLNIRDEYSKTFGRVIKLKLCVSLIKEFIKVNNLGPNDFLITKKPPAFNKYLKTHAEKLFGTNKSQARKAYNKMRIYDIRHNACCYWLKRYQKTRGIMYRMGWSEEKEVRYYSEFIGLADDISDTDMVGGEDKSIYQKKILSLEQQKEKQGFLVEKLISKIEELQSQIAFTSKKENVLNLVEM